MSNAIGHFMQGLVAVAFIGALLFSCEGDRIERMWNHTPPPTATEPKGGER